LAPKLYINETIETYLFNITIDSAPGFFAVKENDKEPIRFHRTLVPLSKKPIRIKCKI